MDEINTAYPNNERSRNIIKKYSNFSLKNNFQIISAEVPLAQMFGYATELRSLTQGRAVFTMQFSHYSPLPQKLQDEITEKYSGSTVSN